MVHPHDDLMKQVRHVNFTKKETEAHTKTVHCGLTPYVPSGRQGTVEGPYEASMSKLPITHQAVLVSTITLKSSMTRGQAQAAPDQLHSDIFCGSKDSEQLH